MAAAEIVPEREMEAVEFILEERTAAQPMSLNTGQYSFLWFVPSLGRGRGGG